MASTPWAPQLPVLDFACVDEDEDMTENAVYRAALSDKCGVVLDRYGEGILKYPRRAQALLEGAAASGNIVLCYLAKGCGAEHFDMMLREAARWGQREIVSLAIEWGADNLDEALEVAARYGRRGACDALCAAGAANHEEAAEVATKFKHPRVLEELKSWRVKRKAEEWSPLPDAESCEPPKKLPAGLEPLVGHVTPTPDTPPAQEDP
jgi:hypothetical protein